VVLERHQEAVEAVEVARAADRAVTDDDAHVELVADDEELQRGVGAVLRQLAALFLVAAAGIAVVDAVANDLGLGGGPRRLVEHAIERDHGAGGLSRPDHVVALGVRRRRERGDDADQRDRKQSVSHGTTLLGCERNALRTKPA
jgi:hypothetical protein